MKIVIDAGHGGKDPGAVGNGLREKDLTLTLALRIGELLAARGADVRYTRQTDIFVELSDRAKFANQCGADYFLSVHINAGGGTGFESYVYSGSTGATAAYQNVIHQKVALLYTQDGLPDRGKKQGNLSVLRETNMPAILLEYGFVDSARDAARLADPAWLERLAQATCAGVAAAFGLPDAPLAAPVYEVSEWACEAQAWAVEQGITDGSRPKDTVTREELWTMLYRAFGAQK